MPPPKKDKPPQRPPIDPLLDVIRSDGPPDTIVMPPRSVGPSSATDPTLLPSIETDPTSAPSLPATAEYPLLGEDSREITLPAPMDPDPSAETLARPPPDRTIPTPPPSLSATLKPTASAFGPLPIEALPTALLSRPALPAVSSLIIERAPPISRSDPGGLDREAIARAITRLGVDPGAKVGAGETVAGELIDPTKPPASRKISSLDPGATEIATSPPRPPSRGVAEPVILPSEPVLLTPAGFLAPEDSDDDNTYPTAPDMLREPTRPGIPGSHEGRSADSARRFANLQTAILREDDPMAEDPYAEPVRPVDLSGPAELPELPDAPPGHREPTVNLRTQEPGSQEVLRLPSSAFEAVKPAIPQTPTLTGLFPEPDLAAQNLLSTQDMNEPPRAPSYAAGIGAPAYVDPRSPSAQLLPTSQQQLQSSTSVLPRWRTLRPTTLELLAAASLVLAILVALAVYLYVS